MSENNGTKILLAFIAGSAMGAAIGYFLNSDHKDELINVLVDNFRKVMTDSTTENPVEI